MLFFPCRNLLSLKYHEGNIEDLALNFTVTVDHMGQTKVSWVEGQTRVSWVEGQTRVSGLRDRLG